MDDTVCGVMAPTLGITVRAHVDRLLTEMETTITEVAGTIRHTRRVRPALREELRRRLAGVVANGEALRQWLDAGAPQ
jgi:siroheme synthase (precorrin-2 oxidase/ferrochelatase)